MKVVSALAQAGYLETIRGRAGGFRLGKPAENIRIGEIVRFTEPSLQPADCAGCALREGCGLTPVLGDAVQAFLAVLDERTLADVASASPQFGRGARSTPPDSTSRARIAREQP